MLNLTPLVVLPEDIQRDWRASLIPATPTSKGVFHLVNARRTEPGSYEEQRVIVLIIDENGIPLPNVKIAFSFSTASSYILTQDFLWSPPLPHKAFIVPTEGSGQIDQIQGSGVKAGESGGITVYILESEYSSDIVAGVGMLDDHTGLHLTFMLQRTGVRSLMERMDEAEARLDKLENA